MDTLATYASGAARAEGELRHRRRPSLADDLESADDLSDIIKQTLLLTLSDTPRTRRMWTHAAVALALTLVAGTVRFYGIGRNQKVIWDEAHFGKFGSYYIEHQFYFDVHPPLGKLLVGLLGWLAGFDGAFKFDLGKPFPPGNHFTRMRIFNCVFGVLCTPVAYFTAVNLRLALPTAVLVALLVALEMLSLTLSKFILLDSMLLFFTVLTFFCLTKLHRLRANDALISPRGIAWLAATGVLIGCVCSVKWVGLFVTLLVGFYTIYDLLVKFYQTTLAPPKSPAKLSWFTYGLHWFYRVVCLIIIPLFIYILAFKVHFAVLSKSGPGDGSISTLLQASLEGNILTHGPRTVAFGSLVSLRSQGLSPNLLHSHAHLYPEGSRQQQITTYGFKDNNNDFLIEFDLHTSRDQKRFATLEDDDNGQATLDYKTPVRNGDTVRLMHKNSGCFLHSHSIAAPVLKAQYEVSCYGNIDILDEKDDWIIEIQNHGVSPEPAFQNEDPDVLHPVSTNFRLKHKVLGCYLATTGYAYPAWGFQQGEVICKKSFLAKDKSTWWNVEDHVNNEWETPSTPYVAPKPNFWKEFVLLNYGMMASNNALVPDPDHHDHLASSWWEWPILRTGLRMSGWSPGEYRYFLMGHPFVTYLSTLCVPIAVLTLIVTFLRWQRQTVDLSVFSDEWDLILSAGILPLLGWFLHYCPFVIMGRVTYLHHYIPALYFAIFVMGFVVEYFVARRTPKTVGYVIYALLYAGVIGVFYYYSPLAMGMVGPLPNFKKLQLLRSWRL